MDSTKILVPTDFTTVGDTAIIHAATVAKVIGGKVYLLHIIERKSELSEARLKLRTQADKMAKETGVPIDTVVRIGSIFEDIDKVANEIEASLIIMGTHGLRGMQFLTGSRALKIVTESSVPFIIVQERGMNKTTGYDDIVVPLDLHKETKQKLALVADMAKYFNSTVHLISPGETDEFLKNQLDRNMTYAQTFLSEKDIKCTVKITEGSGNFVKSVIKHAVTVEADLITIMNFYENSLMGILGGSYEQQMITNEPQIPVLVINPKEVYVMNRSVFAS